MSEKKQQEMIAFYQVHFVFTDGKDLNINMAPQQLKEFFDLLNKKQIFWYGDDKQNPEMGFWTDLDKVRFIQLRAIKGVMHAEHAPAIEDSQKAPGVSKVETLPKS